MDTMESRVEATHRLQREGRWNEASVFRDRKRKVFRDEGKKRGEANEEAWQAMIAEYPPLPPPVTKSAKSIEDAESLTDDDDDFEDLSGIPHGGKIDFVRDILWVYGSLEKDDVSPADCPSLGAWGLLKYALEDRREFYKNMLPKAISQKAKEEVPPPAEQDAVNRARLQKMLDEAMKQ